MVDPLDGRDDATVINAVGDFDCLQELALRATGELRQGLEETVARQVVRQPSPTTAGWSSTAPSAPRNRGWSVSSSRSPGSISRARRGALAPVANAAPDRRLPGLDGWWPETPVTAWYQRFCDATGRDPRHALVRVETSADVTDSDEIDRIAAWVLAERTPRATADDRWATLLYPVHYLERILKRQLEADTRGWPSPTVSGRERRWR